MMLSNKDPNGGGRTSRASNVSALSRTSGKTAQRPPSSDFPALVGRGVSLMLRTETELGNVGGVVLDDLSGAGSMHRTLQRHRAPSRMSTASSMSNTSSRASKHFRGYPSSSSAPRHSTGPYGLQHAPNVLSPPMPNAPATASLDGLSNRDRDPQRSRSMTNTMQPPYALSSNRSLTSLRPAHGSHIQNPYVYPSSYGAGLMPLNSNHRPISPALSDSTGLRPRASHRFEEQRLSNGGYGQTYSNMGRTHRKRGQQHGGQGQQYRGLGNPHNVGQMRTRLPSQPSSLSLEDRREEEDSFPPYDSMAYDEQIEGLHSGNPHLRRDRLANRYHDYRSEVPPLPANHRHRIAVEHARFKRPAPGSVSSGSTNLRTDSDVQSSDMTSPPTPKDGVEMMHNRDGTRVVDLNSMSPNKLIVSEEKTSVAYYDYSEQFEHDEYAQPDTRGIPTGFVDRNRTIIEQCVPTSGVAALNSDSFLGQGAQPMSMVVVPPNPNIIANHANVATSMDNPNTAQLANIAELPASPVARRITRDLILRGLEASTTGDTQSLAKSLNTITDNELTDSVELPVKTHLAADEQVGMSLDSVQNKENRHSILSQAGSSILDSSTLNFAVRHSIPVATRGGFEEIARDVGSDANMAASPGRSTEDGLSDVLAGYRGNDSKSETNEALRDITSSEKHMRAEEHTATPADDDMKPLPLSVRSASNHAHKLSDEQSFKSCTDMPDESSGPALSKSQNDCTTSRSAVNIVREREERPKVSEVCSFTTARVPASPDYDAFVPPSRIPSSSLGTMVMKKKKGSSDMSFKQPAPVLRKQLQVLRRESSFSTVANKLRPNSKSSVRQSSLSASGSSSTLSITHPPLAVPQRDSSASKEAQRVHAAVSFLMRPLPSRFAKGLRRTDSDDLSMSDEMVENALGSPKDTESCPASRHVSVSLSAADTGKPIEKAPLTPAGVPPKTRVIRFDPPEADNQYNVFVSSPVPVKDQQTPSDMLPVAPEPSSVYSIQDHSASNREEACPDVVPAPSEANRRDSQTTTHLEWHHYVQPVAAPESQQLSMRPSNGVESHLESLALAPLTNNQEDSTTDLRLSRYRYPGPSRYLPDLKEESHEDSSLNTSASNLKSSSFRYPFGVPSGIRASGEDPVNFSRRSSSMASCRRSGVDSSVGGALGQTHGLPSMRFSRINLFDGLPEDLGLRYSRSMEEVAHVSQRLSRSNPPRPASAGDVKGLQISLAELEEVERSGFSMQPGTMMSLLAMHGAHSPELMAEIERLTIPSVGGLTQRFSEFFPSLREYYKSGESAEFPVEEEIEKHALEEINEVHPTQKRSSARLRPIRGVSHMVVIDDDLYEEMTNKEKKSNSSRIDESVAAKDASGAGSTGGESEKGKGVTTTPTHHGTTSLSKVQGPSPVFLRPRSHTVNLQAQRHSGESALSSRRSLRSFVSTPTATETRPWNSDKNYPWATSTNPSIDISLPPPTTTKHSPRPGPSHLRNRLSEASSASSFSTAQTATASPFGSPADSTAHAHQHRFSSFGRSNDQPHEVGERYPTSALSPPTAIFRDHLSASDTSDDEYYDTTRKTRLSLRKRFSSTHKNTLPNPASTRASRGKSNQDPAPPESTRPSAISIVQDSVGEAQAFSSSAKVHRHTFRDAEGMRAADYRKQRIIECLKTWWHKSSRLIRHLSIRKDSNTSTI